MDCVTRVIRNRKTGKDCVFFMQDGYLHASWNGRCGEVRVWDKDGFWKSVRVSTLLDAPDRKVRSIYRRLVSDNGSATIRDY